MNVLELLASVELDDQGYLRSLNAVERSTERTARSMESTWDRRLGNMQRSLNNFGNRARQVGSNLTTRLTLPIAGLGAAIVATAADFESSMNRVRGITNTTGQDFEELRNLAQQLGETTQFSASQAADGMTFLAQAGFDAKQILDALPGTLELAAAGQLSLAEAADIASNVLTGFGLQAAEVGRVNDTLAKTSTSANTDIRQLGQALSFVAPVAAGMGVNIEEASAAIGLLSNAGIQATRAGTSLRRIYSTLASEADELGIATTTAAGDLRPLADILDDLRARGLTTSEALEVFGQRAGPALTALLSSTPGALRELTGELENAEGWAAQLAETQMAGLPGALRELRSAVEGLALSIADSGFGAWVQNSIEGITRFVRRISDLEDRTLTTITKIAGALAVGGPLIVGLGFAAGAVSNLISVVVALKAVFLAAAGPAGWVVLLATVVGGTLFEAWRRNRGAMDETIETTREVRDAFNEAQGDTEALTGVVNDLSEEMGGTAGTAFQGFARELMAAAEQADETGKAIGETNMQGTLMARVHTLAGELEGDAREAFINWASQALASADDVEEAAAILEQAYARVNNAAEIAATQQRITRLEMELTDIRNQRQQFQDTMGAQRVEDLEEGLQRLRDQGATAEQIAIQERRIAEARQDSSSAVQRLNDAMVGVGAHLSDARAQLRELKGLTGDTRADMEATGEAREPTITPDVVPDPNNPDADEANPTGLPADGDEREVTIYTKRAGGTFLTPAEQVYADFLLGRGAGGPSQATGRFAEREGFGPNVRPPLVEEPGRGRGPRNFGPREGFGPTPGAPLVTEPGRGSGPRTFGPREGFGTIPGVVPVTIVDEPGTGAGPRSFGPREGFGAIPSDPLTTEPGRGAGPRRFGGREGFGPIDSAVPVTLVEEPGTGAGRRQFGPREGFGALPNRDLIEEPGGRLYEGGSNADAVLDVLATMSREAATAGGRYGEGAPTEEVSAFEKALETAKGVVASVGDSLGQFGNAMLATAQQHFPVLTGAITALVQGGPLAMFASLIQNLIGETDTFKDLLAVVGELLKPFIAALEPLVGVLIQLLNAIEPVIDLFGHLFSKALQPVIWVLENLVVPAFRFVADAIVSIYNALLGWLFGRIETDRNAVDDATRNDDRLPGDTPASDVEVASIGDAGVSFRGTFGPERGTIAYWQDELAALQRFHDNTRDPEMRRLARNAIETRRGWIANAQGQQDDTTTPSPTPPRPTRPTFSTPSRGSGGGSFDPSDPDPVWNADNPLNTPEQQFGAVGQSIQLAVATPLVVASEMMRDAAATMQSVFGATGGEGVFADHANAMREHTVWMQRLAGDGMNVNVNTSNGGARGVLPRYI